MDKDDSERSQKMIEEQITRALATKGEEVHACTCTCIHTMYNHVCNNKVCGNA